MTSSIFDEWILKHWDRLRSPTLAAVLVVAAFSKNKHGVGEGRKQLDRITKGHPWVKVYLAVYGIIAAVGVTYVLLTGIDVAKAVGFLQFAITIGLLVLPILVIRSKEASHKAGEKT